MGDVLEGCKAISQKREVPMRSLLTAAAFGALLAVPYSAPASAQQSPDCGKYGMTCAPMGKNLNYTTGTQSPDCGKYGMTCAKSATTANAVPTSLTTGRSAATRVRGTGAHTRH
jgi:hypothetical protein